MTQNEEKLLDIAKDIIDMNQDISAKLTGSLMLAVRGVNKRREALDIDIICDCMCEKAPGYPNVPKGFKLIDIDGSKSQVEAIRFVNSEGIKVEFMQSEEDVELINGIRCCNVDNLIEAKGFYVKNDKYMFSILKHKDDLEYLFEHNPELNK